MPYIEKKGVTLHEIGFFAYSCEVGQNIRLNWPHYTLQLATTKILNMIKKTTLLVLMAIQFALLNGQTWIDITDDYIVNPRFDNNDVLTGWHGTSFSTANPHENAEHYSKTFDTYQEIEGLNAGHYRLSLDCFYRMGSANNDWSLYDSGNYSDYQYANLYAQVEDGYHEVAIVPASSAALKEPLGGATSRVGNGGWWWWGGGDDEDTYYIPNNMEAAWYWFEAGYYDNSLEFDVGSDGKLTIGISKYQMLDGDWTCLDNWQLEYYGSVTLIQSISLSNTSLEMTPSETHTLTYTLVPSDATIKKLSWSSDDESVATVDGSGTITAKSPGTCSITATSTDGSQKSATCMVKVTENVPTNGNIVINEIMASNVDVYLDPSMNYGSWVELYNPSSKSIALGGLYVSDDPNDLLKYRLIDSYGALPANGYAILNFDHHEVWTERSYRQIDGNLDCDGGTIIISDGSTILAQQDYPVSMSRISYARTVDGGEDWSYTGNPTPGSSNQEGGGFSTQQLPAPTVDIDGQLFSSPLQVCVNIPEGATLKYTTDGTAPTLTNGDVSETGLFTVEMTSCYRFRLFQEGYLPSPVVTRSYIEDNGNYPFPIISVVTDLNNIYDNNIGVFMRGDYGRPGNGQSSKCNWNMDWDRPVSFEYITTDNECIVAQECDFSMCGGWSRAWTPHAFKLKAKKQYDLQNSFPAQFFPDKPFLKHKTLQIRNGGNDTSNRIKDPALQMLVARSGLNCDYQSWQPVHVFLNGDHYAVLNMREPNNKDFGYTNFGLDTDEMDQFEISPDSGYVQMRGTKESFERLVELSETSDDESTYEEIRNLLDIDEYINYMAVEFYLGNWDWPQNNVKGYRDQNDGKFRFVLFDLDGSFSSNSPISGFLGKEWYTFDTLYGYDYSRDESVSGRRNYRQIEFVTLFKNMLKNPSFRKQFIDTFCIVGGSVFHTNHVRPIVEEMRDYLNTGGYVNSSSTASSVMSNLTSSRNSTMISHIKNGSGSSYLSEELSGVNSQSVKLSSNVSSSKILINDIELPYTDFDGYLYGPIKLEATVPSGYKFLGWKDKGGTLNRTTLSIFSKGMRWSYYDEGSLDDVDWKSSVDGNWPVGSAPLGYFTSDPNNARGYQTVLNYGGDPDNKYPTYYFTCNVSLTDTPTEDDIFQLDYTCDDGFVIYVNGEEGGRYLMHSGTPTFDTFATTYAPGNPDSGTMEIDPTLFHKGNNVIAVEVHNNQGNSTDIYWDASLTAYLAGTQSTNYLSTELEFDLPEGNNLNIQAFYQKIDERELSSAGFVPVTINEVGASNSIYVNEYFKKNDWIELYNNTDKDIDISGMYISDKVSEPLKYQIPSASSVDSNYSTTIPAHGHLVLWADKNDPMNQIHTGFKLGNDDNEVVILTSSDESWADTLIYASHNGDQSFGVYPDGSKSTYIMNIPTIGKDNMLDSYCQAYEGKIDGPEPSGIATRTVNKSGSLSLVYKNDELRIQSDEPTIANVEIFTMGGQLVLTTRLAVHSLSGVSTGNIPNGIYTSRVVDSEGNRCVIKFIKQ